MSRTSINAFILMLLLTSGHAESRSWSMTDTTIPYFAMVRGNMDRNFLVVNTDYCAAEPQACLFFAESMDSHRFLNHMILPPQQYNMLHISLADCFAVRLTSPESIKAAYELMLDNEKAQRYRVAGNLAERAEKLKTCAIKKDKWASSGS